MRRQVLYFLTIILFALISFWFLESKIKVVAQEMDQIALRHNYFDVKKLERSMKIVSPLEGKEISSPVKISGSVAGRWFFEGSILGKIIDANGNILGMGPLSERGDFIAHTSVSFEGVLPFAVSQTKNGFIVLEANDPNASGQIPSFKLPVTFDDADLACIGEECSFMCAPGMISTNGFCEPSNQAI